MQVPHLSLKILNNYMRADLTSSNFLGFSHTIDSFNGEEFIRTATALHLCVVYQESRNPIMLALCQDDTYPFLASSQISKWVTMKSLLTQQLYCATAVNT